MRNQKRYSTQTFTKRVDHEGGSHRSAKKGTEAVCSVCGSIYRNNRWTRKGAGGPHGYSSPGEDLRKMTCPACKQAAEGIVGGYVLLDGDFVRDHRHELDDLIRNEERRAQEDNPLSRIMSRVDVNGSIKIETTNEHLAQRLGRALEKAYDGTVTYDFSHENKVVRVHWHRD